ncbi:hypothetical protein Moror_2254 [Moniliophthora roreri MCA 2997]|uniref:Uncharacterized protein n=1 Tax=Moniliophthora roreri (strain MCA 2997) TaxID=1381753 RepID=V2WI19_MONRO|nr:hypothetical protein Moror_2254 [Moniliophthora roreri MCA 2997]
MDQFKGTIANPKATYNDVTKTFQRMAETAQNLLKRAHVLTFGIVCNSKRGQNVPCNFFGTGPIEGFLEMKFNMTCAKFIEAVESYCVLMADGQRKREVNAKKMREAIKS